MRLSIVVTLLLGLAEYAAAEDWAERLRGEETRDRAVAELVGKGGEAIPLLLDLLRAEEPEVRAAAAEALGGIGQEAVKAVPALIRARADEDFDVSLAAALALEAIGAPALPFIIEALDSKDPRLREEAVWALETFGAELAPAVPRLVRMLEEGSTLRERAATAAVLGQCGESARAAIPALIRALSDDQKEVRRNAAGSLGTFREHAASAVSELTRLLEDPAPRVRAVVGLALAAIGEAAEPAIPALVHALSDEDETVRNCAARSIWKLGDRAVDALFERLEQGDEKIRRDLLPAIALGEERSVPRLVALLRSEDPGIRKTAEKAFFPLGWTVIPALRGAGFSGLADEIRRQTLLAKIEGFELSLGEAPAADPEKLSLEWESGGGHAFTLDLCRLHWTRAGLRVERIAYSGHPLFPEEMTRVETATIRPTISRVLLEVLLLAFALRIEELEGNQGWATTADFHARLRIAEGEREVFEGSYTGYHGSMDVPKYYRLAAAASVLHEAVADVVFRPRTVAEEDRVWLLARAGRIFEEEWWVQERLLKIIASIGDRRFEPLLRKYIARKPDDVPRDHLYAIDAYALITGVDLRGSTFTEEELPEVRKLYLEFFERTR